MTRISVLPASVADQIAAGEVVERPASVVKELIENSLDAGATLITVEVGGGGRGFIRVADDGAGMTREDALLSLSRHATSKIARAEDLTDVSSFGFRGEALPAIASVSELMMETSAEDGSGTAIKVADGTTQNVAAIARQRGTTITVSDLFRNVPARRKFLRGERSEWRAVLETIQSIGIVAHGVHFTVYHNGRKVMDIPAAHSLRDRLAMLRGPGEVERFVDVDDVSGTIHVSGLTERPADAGLSSRKALLIVNGRIVRDPGLVRALESAYRSTIPHGVRPSFVLAVHLSGGDVDVNVHPAKAEVRFRDRWNVERAVEDAVRRALGLPEASATVGWRVSSSPHSFAPAGSRPSEGWMPRGVLPSYLEQRTKADLFADQYPSRPASRVGENEEGGSARGQEVSVGSQGGPGYGQAGQSEVMIPTLRQLRRTYLMYEHEEGIVLIDQHSAHERILFEKFMNALTGGTSGSQRLLFPFALHLEAAEAEVFEENRSIFEALGFEVAGFGGRSLLVSAVPSPHPRFDAEKCLRETLAQLAGDRDPSMHATHERLIATVACKAAIKAGDELSVEEMRSLYALLATTELPAHDVHGRATIVRLGWDEVERRFGRR